MLASQDKRKIRGFKEWLRRNEDVVVLSVVADMIPQKRVAAIIKALEANGYPLDERGVPIVGESNEEYRGFILTLHKTFEELTRGDLPWGLFTPFLGEFMRWLKISGYFAEPRWWHAVDWERISYKTLGRIAKNLLIRGCIVDNCGIPFNWGAEEEHYWKALDESILEALVEAASEY
jgi:hypothetical protein